MHVLLFDIDGTLIHSGGAGYEALHHALEIEFGVPVEHQVEVHGRTDRSIAGDMFIAHGIPNTEDNWNRFRNAYLSELPRRLLKTNGRVLPGVAELLNDLQPRDDLALGLLTGNVRDGARIKLEHFQLFHHFLFGGFGDRFPERNDVAKEAWEAAKVHLDVSFHPDRVWVIGDTPRDVLCARAIGARVIVVATGFYSRDELAASNPDLVLNDLCERNSMLGLLGAHG